MSLNKLHSISVSMTAKYEYDRFIFNPSIGLLFIRYKEVIA